MKVLIVGLPLFATRLYEQISSFDSKNTYYVLDTYYNKWDKLKALFLIPKVDVVMSINGTLTQSKVIDLAFKHNKKVVFNWVGTDVQLARKAVETNQFIEKYRSEAMHLCEVDWIQDELNEIGIQAEVQNFAVFEKHFEEVPFATDQLNVLTYIANARPEFYGIKTIIQLAKQFPEISFSVAGLEKYPGLPKNINLLGWVDDMTPHFNRAQICLRYAEHDGLSNFILEALARGKYVLYNQTFPFCLNCSDFQALEARLKDISKAFEKDALILNKEGAQFVQENFNRKAIFEPLIERLKS